MSTEPIHGQTPGGKSARFAVLGQGERTRRIIEAILRAFPGAVVEQVEPDAEAEGLQGPASVPVSTSGPGWDDVPSIAEIDGALKREVRRLRESEGEASGTFPDPRPPEFRPYCTPYRRRRR